MSVEIRLPLSPVAEPNFLGGAPPPVDLPDAFKGENAEGTGELASRMEPRSTPTPTTLTDPSDSGTPTSEMPSNVITPIQVPPAEAPGCALTGPATTDTSTTLSPDYERGWGAGALAHADPLYAGATGAIDTGYGRYLCEQVEDDATKDESAEDEDAVMALLSLQRNPSVVDLHRVTSTTELSRAASTADLSGGTASPRREGVGDKRWRSASPLDFAAPSRGSPVPKPGADGESRYFCRHPGCGKGYASTDAVRKHCRQRHLEWLRRLGHGCPALYCRWGDASAGER